MEKTTGILLAAAAILIAKGGFGSSGGGGASAGIGIPSNKLNTGGNLPPGSVTLIPGGAGSSQGSGVSGGGSSSVVVMSPKNLPAMAMPILPPGTTPAVAQAVQEAYDAGTLTVGQAEAVSSPAAPMYNPQVIIPVDNSAQAAADAQAAQDQLNLTAEEILSGAGNQGTTAGPSLSVVDYGSSQAAEEALAAYWANFVY